MNTSTYNLLRTCRRKCLLLPASIILIAAQPSSRSGSASDDLYRLFQVDSTPADIVFLPDASKSMQDNHYSAVRRAVIDFIATLDESENVHLRIFGDVVSNPLEGKHREIAGLVEDYFPKEPLFAHTDLGLAISKGLEFLERDGASEVQAFFLITDGLHQPPSGSPYSREFSSDPNWQELKSRALALCRRRSVLVYGFGLGQLTDISVLRRVFPAENVEVIVGSPTQIMQTLKSARERLSRAQLRRALLQELNTGLVRAWLDQTDIEVEGSSFNARLAIRNDYSRLPIIIERIEVQRGSGGSDRIACLVEGLPVANRIEPGKQIAVWIKGELVGDDPGFRIGRDEQSFHGAFRFAPVISFQHQAALDQLGTDLSASKTETPILTVQVRVHYGTSYWVVAAAALVLAGLGAVVRRQVKKKRLRLTELAQRRVEYNRLAGTLNIWRAGHQVSNADSIDLGQFEEQELALAITDAGTLEVVMPCELGRDVVARLSGHLNRCSALDSAPEIVEFHLASAGNHKLAYESGGEMCETLTLTLCDNDVIQLDGRWRLRYANHRLRTRAEFESAAAGGNNNGQ